MPALPRVPGIEIVTALGRGGYGAVYQGRWIDDLLPTALKVLHTPDDDSLRRFQREANMLRELQDCPHVVDVYAWDMDGNPPWISMELCEGSLHSWTQPGHGKDANTVMVALAHAAAGLTALHAEEGFHRDIKPANLLIARADDGAPLIKIGDFGLARSPLVGESTLTRRGHGTPAFIAPELQRYADGAGPPCDVYSLGVTGLYLLAGTTDLGALRDLTLPNGLGSLLAEMVAMDPRDRPNSHEVLTELRKIIARAAVQPVRPPTRNRAAPAANAGALAGILLGALAVGGALAIGAALMDDS